MEQGGSQIITQLMRNEACSLVMHGSFSDRSTPRLLEISEALLAQLGVTKSMRNKIAFAMVETFQNIVRHGTEDGPASTFLLISDGSRHRIMTVNSMKSAEVEGLTQHINSVNGKSREELKAMFLQELGSGDLSEKGGAGLGLIEMARRSGYPLGAEFVASGEGNTSFMMRVAFGEAANANTDLETINAIHLACQQHGTTMSFKGELGVGLSVTLLAIASDLLGTQIPAINTAPSGSIQMIVGKDGSVQVQQA